MKTLTYFVCEICLSQYEDEKSALKCEAQGLPEPMPFLPWDRPIPAFGESGPQFGTLKKVWVEARYGQHEWWVRTEPYVDVSHNIESGYTPAQAFDPRKGWDGFRYDQDLKGLRIWEETLCAYGFTEADVDPYMMDKIRQIRRRLLPHNAPAPPQSNPATDA